MLEVMQLWLHLKTTLCLQVSEAYSNASSVNFGFELRPRFINFKWAALVCFDILLAEDF